MAEITSRSTMLRFRQRARSEGSKCAKCVHFSYDDEWSDWYMEAVNPYPVCSLLPSKAEDESFPGVVRRCKSFCPMTNRRTGAPR
jgi:hypothetical protein